MKNDVHPDLSHYTLVLVEEGRILFTSEKRGIAPLLECLERFTGQTGHYILHDRVTGLAAARLVVHCGFIAEVITRLISEPARACLNRHGIAFKAELVVPQILNRNRSASCPAESIAQEIEMIEEMMDKLKKLAPPPTP
jgi:hypothetical protein